MNLNLTLHSLLSSLTGRCSKLLVLAVDRNLFKAIKVGSDFRRGHGRYLHFADHTILFLDEDGDILVYVLPILKFFEAISGNNG